MSMSSLFLRTGARKKDGETSKTKESDPVNMIRFYYLREAIQVIASENKWPNTSFNLH